MIQGILATEMSEHGTHITKVDKLTSDFPSITHRIAKWAAASGGDLENNPARPNYLYPGGPSSSSSSWMSSPPLQTMESQSSVAGSRAWSKSGQRARQVPGAEAAALGLADCDRLTVASALLHAADLSSPGRPFATCEVWVLRLLEEFKFQAEQVCVCVCVLLVRVLFFFLVGVDGRGHQKRKRNEVYVHTVACCGWGFLWVVNGAVLLTSLRGVQRAVGRKVCSRSRKGTPRHRHTTDAALSNTRTHSKQTPNAAQHRHFSFLISLSLLPASWIS